MIKRLSFTLAVAVAGLLLCVGASCPPKPPPVPVPTPTPGQTLLPITVKGNLFEVDGRRFDLRLLSDCCDDPRTPDVDEGLRNGWPITSKTMIDKYASAPPERRRNSIEMRLGPYRHPQSGALNRLLYRAADTLDGYDSPPQMAAHKFLFLTRSPGARYQDGYDFLPQVKEVCKHANSKGFYCYNVVVDMWTFASSPEVNIWGDDCSVTQQAPQERHLQWAKAVGETFRGMGVLYSLDNEGFRCKPSEAWEDGLYAALKAVDPAAIIGSSHRPNQGFPEPGRRLYDFVSMQDTFQLSPAQAIPVVLVEPEGHFHPEAHWRLLESKAEKGVYVGRWRAVSSDAEWLYMVGAGPDPGPVCSAFPEIGHMNVKRFYPTRSDATPLVVDPQWCGDHGFPDRLRCPFGPEGDVFFRSACEMEKGWPYTWTLDDIPCASTALQEGAVCWDTENPLAEFVPRGNDGRRLRVCASNGICGSVVW